ncbi:MAG: hypothetical protein IPG76_06690 [Acidobacteria bacterium]|nr:hypothetical protein [Acidobacteriota bacterium]
MPEQAIRFGISDGNKHRAATWKLWTPSGKSDVYLACRPLGGALKASLHQSGNWHVAYNKVFFTENVEGEVLGKKDRFITKWSRPTTIALGVILAFRIITPFSAVTTPVIGEEKEMTWLPNCPEPQATEIDIFIVSPTTPVTGWPGKNKMETQLVGAYILANGESVWAVYRVVDMPDLSSALKGTGHFYKGRNEGDLKSDNLRAIIIGNEPDGSRVMYDCVVVKKGS